MDLPVWIPINKEVDEEKMIKPIITYKGISYTFGYSSSFS